MVKRRITFVFAAILCFAGLIWAQAVEAKVEIPIVLTERAGLDWKSTPFTVGVPVPSKEGAFSSPPRMLDQMGREVASQAVLLPGPTGKESPGWWRLTFLGTINQNDSLVYRAVFGEEQKVQPRTAVKVEKTVSGYLVENSSVRLELSTDQPIVAKAWFDPNGRGSFKDDTPLLVAPLEIGIRTTAASLGAKAMDISLEEHGPVRAVFRLKGVIPLTGIEGPFSYDCRLIIYADTPFIRLEVRLINTTGGQLTMEEAWLKTTLNLKEERGETTFGAGKGARTSALNKNAHAQLVVDHSGGLRWGGIFGSASIPQGSAGIGWADLSGPVGGVSVGIKDFGLLYPKGLQVNGTGEIKIQFLPVSSPLIWEAGVAKTHHLTLNFHGVRDRDSTKYIDAVTNKSPVAMPAGDWLNETEVLSQPLLTKAYLGELDAEVQPLALLLKEKQWSELLNLYGPPTGEREINAEHWGFYNYGDLSMAFSVPWAKPGQYWNNNAYDLPYQLLCAYLQTADPALLEIGEAALTHWQDVDLVNPTANPRPFPGLDHHKDPLSGMVSVADDFLVFENRGLLLGYYLLDDQFGYELALRMADRLTLQAGVNFRDLRTVGAGLMTLLAAYQASGWQRYLESAAQLVELVLGWLQQQGGGLPTDFIYKAGLVTDSLVAYYHITKDPRVLTGIQGATDHALYHFWDRETGLIQNRGGVLFTSALDLLYRETREEKYYLYNKDQVNAWTNREAVQQPKDVALSYRTIFTFFNGARFRNIK